jgi:predicted transcriptional regulator
MQLSLRLSRDLMRRLQRLADARGVDRSRCLRDLIREASMTPQERSEAPDRDELMTLLADKARDGHVGAIRLLLDRVDRPAPFDPFADLDGEFDEIYRRNAAEED